MKYKSGDLIFDPRLNMAGMVMNIEDRKVGGTQFPEQTELWYRVMLFGDHWCVDGKTRDYAIHHGDNLLEAYNEEEHKGLTRDEAEHDVDELSRVFLNNIE